MDAVVDFPREDRVPALDLVIEHYSAGQPIPPLMGYMDEAAFWADLACRAELKAYMLACWRRLSAADKAAFLAYVQRKGAA